MAPADVAILSLIGLAVLRGLWIGLTRELFSVLTVAVACVALRTAWTPLAQRVTDGLGLDWLAARVAAAVLLVGGTVVLLALLRAAVRRGVRAAGLGFWDRLFGGVLGAAEGAVVAALLLLVAVAALGREHALLAGTRSLAAFERLEVFAAPEERAVDVAAPPARR